MKGMLYLIVVVHREQKSDDAIAIYKNTIRTTLKQQQSVIAIHNNGTQHITTTNTLVTTMTTFTATI